MINPISNSSNTPLVIVNSPNVKYNENFIETFYNYETVHVTSKITSNKFQQTNESTTNTSTPPSTCYIASKRIIPYCIRTQTHIPKTGLLIVGLGGNNGSTVLAGILANKYGLQWETKEGIQKANWFGSLCISSTVKLGIDPITLKDIYVPLNSLLPMIKPTDFVIGGWDISSMKLGDAMKRAKVLDVQLQKLIYDEMQTYTPMKSVFFSDFVAQNQKERADNLLSGSHSELLSQIRQQIRDFKSMHNLDKVIIVWSATTEKFSQVIRGVNTTAEELMNSITNNHSEISPSTLYAMASILEGCSYINGSPQNTFVPGVEELAIANKIFIGGNDFKSGQTKLKSVMVDFLVSAGIKPTAIVSYNHLGNNDGYNLSSPMQFRSKELSKSNVVDDMVESNAILYKNNEKPDHCVVIKYVPYVGDSKRAMDEYTSEIFMGGHNTIVVHNTCEDSLLAAPLIMDLAILTEFAERVTIQEEDQKEEKLHSILSLLSYLLKAPIVPNGIPIVNALHAQRESIVDFLRACIGLPPTNYLMLEHKVFNTYFEIANENIRKHSRLN